MPTGIVRPNGNNNTLWSIYDYTRINDNVVQPNAGDGVCIEAYFGDESERQQYDMTTIAGAASISNITLWVRASRYNAGYELGLNIAPGGVWQTPQSMMLGDSLGWGSASFDGNWTQADLDGLLIGLTSSSDLGQKQDEGSQYVDVAYCVVTYEGPTAKSGSDAGADADTRQSLAASAAGSDAGAATDTRQSLAASAAGSDAGAGAEAAAVTELGNGQPPPNDPSLDDPAVATIIRRRRR